jgi:hypothetical protein
MEGLPASYWVPLAGIEKLHGAVVEKLKNSDPEDWVIALDRDSAIKLTRDLAPEVLKSIHEANRPNIAVRFFRAVLSWVTWSGATNYADIQQARFIAGVVEEFSAEADLQALCHEGNLAKLIESLTIENFDSFFRNTDVFTQPALTVLAQHSPRVSEALRKYIAGQEDPDAYIKENLDRLSPDLAMTFFQHIDFSEETKENSAEYVKLLLENVNASDNPKDVQALVDIKKFVTQFEDAIQDPSYRDGVLQNTQPGILFAIAGEASGLRKVLVEGMLPVLRQNLNTPHQLAGDAAEAEQDVFKYIFNNLDAADFFALAKLDSQCSLLILGKDAQKRGFFGKVVDVAASVFSFLQGGEDEVENANLSPDGILERLFNQNVQSQSEGDMHETLDAAISAYLRQEIPLNVLQHYFRLVIQDDNYKLDQFISKFGRGIFEDLTEALSDPEVAETYDYDPQDSRAMDALRADLRDKLVQNFKLFQDLIKVSTAQKIQLMFAGELDVDIPTREEGIASAYNKLNPSQMLGIMRSFLMAPEDNRWFRTWRSPLPISEQSQMHAGYLAEYLQSYLDAGISVGGESRLQHMQNTNSELADEMAFILDQLNEVKAGTYDRIRGPQAVRDHTAINTLSFDPDVDAQAIDDAKHFEGETTWNLTRRRILNNWHAQITSSSGSQMTPWAFNKIIKSMLDVLEEVTEEEGEYSLQGEVYQTRYITPPDVVKLIGQVIDDAASANLITPKAYGLLMKYIQEGRSSGAPGVKELGQALGGQLAIGNPNIGSSIYDAFNLEAPVDV